MTAMMTESLEWTVLVVVATILLSVAIARIGTVASSTPTNSAAPRSSADPEKNFVIRERARKASIARQKVWNEKERQMKLQERLQRKQATIAASNLLKIDTAMKEATMMRATETIPITMVPVFDDGITSFRYMPNLPHAQHAAALIKQIAQNFVPIIRQRAFDIRTVSELCCCGDGLDYILGGGKYCVLVGQNIGGHTASDVSGYNRLEPTRGSLRVHSIHLRMRSVDNHDYLRTYDGLAATMAHELAHCFHRDHGAAFRELMDEIAQQHAEICRLEALTPAREQSGEDEAELAEFNTLQWEEAQRNVDAIQTAIESFDE